MNAIRFKLMTAAAVLSSGALGFGIAAAMDAGSSDAVPVIKVSARRFTFTPGELSLKKGQTVEIELTTEDVPMGFNVPELGTRTTIVPGQVARVRLTPQKTGRMVFLCDLFCGSGHEDMNGVVTVVD